ncbi:ABC transporter substrate-binding protein [Micromonospora polyrhachis]|uniref:Iron(III) transport system substrate-binding protein n=1 Tax=Micromonospora polyrhachis TaxID=1282883 RepID=A0A7W7SWH3_9ACTN|nr:ABC transporter substrate-binding protein [Micromonospora polyrhachis]MBB4962189.1 iron(III) transport system substrate-binding protein [Micromonospora polyrhachis]
MRRHSTRSYQTAGRLPAMLLTGIVLAAAVACAPSSNGVGADSPLPTTSVQDAASFDLNALIEAAKKEGSVLAYDSSGDIVEVAKAFEAKYGIKAEGVKSKSGDTAEKLTRENQADNVTIDVTLFEDGPVLVGELLPRNVVTTWIPPDLAKDIPDANRDPLLVLSKANVWAYNTKLFPNGCPVKSMWELTEPAWSGKVVMQDPLGKPTLMQWLSQTTNHGADSLAQDYQKHAGSALRTSEQNASWEWIKRLAANKPVLTKADEDTTAAVAAPQQKEPRIGLLSIAKFRDVADKGYQMAVCEGLAPWVGFSYDKYGAIAAKSKHPNAAKLFIHFVMTQEGIVHEMGSGGISGNKAVPASPNNPPGLTNWDTQLFAVQSDQLLKDYQQAQTVQDFWRVKHG